jgi:hypothetical protein
MHSASAFSGTNSAIRAKGRARLVAAGLSLIVAAMQAPAALGHAGADERAAIASSPAATIERLSGTIEMLVVDDRVANAIYRYPRLRLADDSVVMLRGEALAGVPAGTNADVSGSRNGAAFDVVSVAKQLPRAPATPRDATAVEVQGEFLIAHADDFVHGRSWYYYEVHDDTGNVTRLELPALPPVLRGGMRVHVDGRPGSGPGRIVPATIVILSAPPERAVSREQIAKAATVNSVLVVMANFNNTVAPSFTSSQVQQVMTSNAGSVGNYYADVSFGQQLISTTVTSTWVTMNLASGACIDANLNAFTIAANAAAINAGYNPSSYGFVVYVFPYISSCGWLGLGYIGSPHLSYINGTSSFFTQAVAHEMGHNFGLLHAGSLRCTGASIGGSCSVSEYGDPFDTMGNINAGHFNAMQKSLLGWIPGSSVVTHSSSNATYTLSPIESAGGSTYAVKIPTPLSTRTYWIEYRQPLGFDGMYSGWVSNGAQIRVANPFETYCSGCDSLSNNTELIDATPGTSSFSDAALVVGSSFTDPAYPITINVMAATPSALTVNVSAGLAASPSTTTLASSVNPAAPGASITFTATVSGTSPTGTVSFNDGGTTLPGCGAAPLGGTGSARTATCATSSLASGVHTLTAAYSGDANNQSSTSAGLTQTINGIATNVSLAASTNPAPAGTTLVFTATVNGNAPTGSVGFFDSGAAVAGCSAVSLAGGGNSPTAQCSTSALAAGAHSLTATYGGDTSNQGSTSAVLVESITASGTWIGFVSGGNQATGIGSAVAAGSNNLASGQSSFVAAGSYNQATGTSALVIGGFDNHAIATDSLVGGGAGNRATAARSVVVGGGYNLASGPWSFIGGGGRDGTASTTAGSTTLDHIAAAKWSTIGGGQGNRAGTLATQTGSTVAGGEQNQALETDTAIGGGTQNLASALAATIAGGQGNTASGVAASVPGGAGNIASGDYSVATGRRAKTQTAAGAPHTGAFVFADSSNVDFNSAAANEFAVRATGGVRLVTAISGTGAPTAGVSVAPGAGTWATLSDRAAKQDLTAIDPARVLAQVAALPLYTWRYRSEVSQALHMGPTAQDFHAAFGLGDSDKTIATVDADGVAFAAIQGLVGTLREQDARLANQAREFEDLAARIKRLEQATGGLTGPN